MYKAVIFDLDGTLFDTLPSINKTLNTTLSHFSLPQITPEKTKQYIGNGARELVRLAIGKDNEHRLDEILAYYKIAYAADDGSLSSLYEGEDKALTQLKKNGVKLAILTNKPHAVALKTDEVYFKAYGFEYVLGQKEGLPLKPAPDGVKVILEALGVRAEDCLFVGDGETDVQTAKNAGVDCVSVLWGYRTENQLREAGATRFAKTFGQLTGFILD